MLDDLRVFFHDSVLARLAALRAWFIERERSGALDPVDGWLRMVCLNRLTGHSPGFFSVYTMPPNQAVGADRQRRINAKRGQTPPPRDVDALILRKSRSLLSTGAARRRIRRRCSARPRPTMPPSCRTARSILS